MGHGVRHTGLGTRRWGLTVNGELPAVSRQRSASKHEVSVVKIPRMREIKQPAIRRIERSQRQMEALEEIAAFQDVPETKGVIV